MGRNKLDVTERSKGIDLISCRLSVHLEGSQIDNSSCQLSFKVIATAHAPRAFRLLAHLLPCRFSFRLYGIANVQAYIFIMITQSIYPSAPRDIEMLSVIYRIVELFCGSIYKGPCLFVSRDR